MRRRILFSGIFLCSFIAVGLLSACGQKGDLYLPATEQTVQLVEQSAQDNSENVKKKQDAL